MKWATGIRAWRNVRMWASFGKAHGNKRVCLSGAIVEGGNHVAPEIERADGHCQQAVEGSALAQPDVRAMLSL